MHKSGLIELESVVAVARRKSFRGAAAEMGMSTTALSNAVAGLEARLGVRLFNRTTRSVSLTEAGEQFVAGITPALAEIRGAVDAVNSKRATPSGTLRINSSLGAAHRILTPIVVEYLRRHPQMSVDLVTEARKVDIVVSGVDAGVRLAEDVPRDMVSVPLQMPLRFAVVGAPELFSGRKRPKKPSELEAYPCICVRQPNGAPYRWELVRKGRKVSVEVHGPLTLDAPTLMREAALHGVGLAYLADWSIAEDVEAGRLIRVLEDWTPSSGGLCLYYPGHRFVPAGLRAFVQVIREVTRGRSAGT
jgi:DNA-binding transcriptional LysR family regulator